MSETLSDIGEFGLIDRIHSIVLEKGVPAPGTVLGIGDDTASLAPRPGFEILVTCDAAVDGRHFLRRFISPRNLGRRTMASNISDIGAMGGEPRYALVSLGLPEKTPVSDVEGLYEGFLDELNPFEAAIIGGNLTKSDGAMFIDITLIGEIEAGRAVLRSSARAGDAILVTGCPGRAAAGLKLLLSAEDPVSLAGHPLVRKYNTPGHRAREGRALALTGLPTAMIDTSDGFAADLGHICLSSGVGAELFPDRFPITGELEEAAAALELAPLSLFLHDSDDYELIITCRPQNVLAVEKVLSAAGTGGAAEVGRMTQAWPGIRLHRSGASPEPLTASGWDHFKRKGDEHAG